MSLTITANLASKGFDESLALSISSKGVTAIFGPSGCGKTSLLRALSGLDRHADTEIIFNKQVWQGESQFMPTYQRGLAYVFQEPSLFEHLSVQQNLDFAIKRRFNNSTDKFEVRQVINLLNIEHLLQRSCDKLSGGERQRVAIARALCTQPQLLLMDEPLSALDLEHKADIIPLLEGVCRVADMPIIYVSHSLDEVARLADSLILMEAGAVVAHGDTAEVLASLESPLAEHANAAAIVNGVVSKQEPDFALTHIDTPAGELCITHAEHLAIDQPVRLKLRARDVSIALERPSNTSILNILDAKITEIRQQQDTQIIIRLDANGAPLLAKITKKSLHLLGLSVGQHVILQIKSVALL